jgi:3-oxoadipate enol-lactonase
VSRALVLPASLGTDRRLWEEQLEAFSRSFQVLLYEHRGRTTVAEVARDALAWLDGQGVERASWCGLSLGGMTGMWIAANAPERLDRLVLACTAARVPSPEAYRGRAAVVRDRGLEPVEDAVVARWFTPSAPPDLSRRFREILLATDPEEYARCCEALAVWDFRDELHRVAVPTLVIAGAAESTDLLAARIPGSRLVTIEGAGHLANVERPAEFAAAALDHLEGR